MMSRLMAGAAIIFGTGLLANGLFMLFDPANWYFAVPGVPDTGPFNQHFIRDIGLIFLLVGLAHIVGAFRSEHRLGLWCAASFWMCGHALFHLWEVATGRCGPDTLARDFPLVTLPALFSVGLCLWASRTPRRMIA
jgi:hypothetical protein